MYVKLFWFACNVWHLFFVINNYISHWKSAAVLWIDRILIVCHGLKAMKLHSHFTLQGCHSTKSRTRINKSCRYTPKILRYCGVQSSPLRTSWCIPMPTFLQFLSLFGTFAVTFTASTGIKLLPHWDNSNKRVNSIQ